MCRARLVGHVVSRRDAACGVRRHVRQVEMAGEEFSASGLMVLERNYLEVYPYDKWTGRKMPTFYEGEHFTPSRLELGEGTTTAPMPLSESDLIGEMEAHSIGTDATIAEHIKKGALPASIAAHARSR
jgi:DNA topoisomerase-3